MPFAISILASRNKSETRPFRPSPTVRTAVADEKTTETSPVRNHAFADLAFQVDQLRPNYIQSQKKKSWHALWSSCQNATEKAAMLLKQWLAFPTERQLFSVWASNQFNGEDENDLTFILARFFRAIPEVSFSGDTQYTMPARIKKKLLTQFLTHVSPEKEDSIRSQITDLCYEARLPPLHEKKLTSSITINEFKHFAQDRYLDVSEYIILGIAALRRLPFSLDQLSNIEKEYLFLNYTFCLKKMNTELRTHLKAFTPTYLPFDREKNDVRRYFETRLSQYMIIPKEQKSLLDSSEMQVSIGRILDFYLTANRTPVTQASELEAQIKQVCNMYQSPQFVMGGKARIDEILHLCQAYQGRDRVIRQADSTVMRTLFRERKEEKDQTRLGEEIWNSGSGALRSLTPMPYDCLSEAPARNLLQDVTRPAPQDDQKLQWSRVENRDYAVFIGSISGHMCKITALLESYMSKHQNDPRLSENINAFFVQVTAVYIKSSFHSFMEIMDVLNDKNIQGIYRQYGVMLDPRRYFDTPVGQLALHQAACDTSEYAKTLALKHQLVRELENHPLKMKI